ncbi:MAG: BrnT family toxin [Acidobacteriota bacterium]
MGNIEFAWDQRKARSNLAKHRVSFEEAKTAFLDENARLIDDPDHSEDEERLLLLGYSFQARCLIVTHCYRHSNSVIRMISARRATPSEEQTYWRLK